MPLPTSSVGSINALAQLPITADSMKTMSPDFLNDPTLGSRTTANPLTGFRQPVASASVYSTSNVPAFLQSEVAKLNAEQALRRSAQAELLDRIIKGASSGAPDAYMWQEALRAASVSPGAHVNFGSSVMDPTVGQGYASAAEAFRQKTAQDVAAINAANAAQTNVTKLTQQRQRLGSSPFGMYFGSPQQRIDQQLFDATLAAQPNSAVQQLGRAAARNSSPPPSLPMF